MWLPRLRPFRYGDSMKLKQGDIVVCVNNGPIPGMRNAPHGLRQIEVGEVYEVDQDQGLFGGVRISTMDYCEMHAHFCFRYPISDGDFYAAERFMKVGSTK